MTKQRNQRGIVSIGCVTTMCIFTVLKKSPGIESTRELPPKASCNYLGPVRVRIRAEKKRQNQGADFETDSPSWELSFQEGDALYKSGHYNDACKVWATTLQLAEHQKAEKQHEDAHALPILDKLAIVYKTQNRPTDAARVYEKAISIASRAYGKDSQEVAHTMLELGHVYQYWRSKNLNKAEELLSEAFAINERLYGRRSIPTGDMAIALAQLEEDKGEMQKAIAHWRLVIDIGNRLEPDVISCCRIGPRQGLARCYERCGLFDEAIAVHKELLEICKKGAPTMLTTVQGAYDQCLKKSMQSQVQPGLDASAK